MKKDQYKFIYEETEDELVITAYCTKNNNKVGHINVVKDYLPWVSSVLVYEEFRRNKIATKMYKMAEDILGKKLNPAQEQTSDAIAFWLYYNQI